MTRDHERPAPNPHSPTNMPGGALYHPPTASRAVPEPGALADKPRTFAEELDDTLLSQCPDRTGGGRYQCELQSGHKGRHRYHNTTWPNDTPTPPAPSLVEAARKVAVWLQGGDRPIPTDEGRGCYHYEHDVARYLYAALAARRAAEDKRREAILEQVERIDSCIIEGAGHRRIAPNGFTVIRAALARLREVGGG